MAAKKKAKRKGVRKKVSAPNEIVTVEVSNHEEGLNVEVVPALVEEAVMKVVDQGRTTYYTESEYRKKFG